MLCAGPEGEEHDDKLADWTNMTSMEAYAKVVGNACTAWPEVG